MANKNNKPGNDKQPLNKKDISIEEREEAKKELIKFKNSNKAKDLINELHSNRKNLIDEGRK